MGGLMSGVSDLRALAHPTRLKMLQLLADAPMCAAELARALGLTHANASYHLRRLVAARQVVAAGEERIRGGLAKRYRSPIRRAAAQSVPPGAAPSRCARVRQRLLRQARAVARTVHRSRSSPGVVRGRLPDWSSSRRAA